MKKLAIGIDISGIITTATSMPIRSYRPRNSNDYPAYATLQNSLSFEYELVGIGIRAPNANSTRA